MITTNPFTTDNYMKAIDELKAVIAKQADEIERLREALKEINDINANQVEPFNYEIDAIVENALQKKRVSDGYC